MRKLLLALTLLLLAAVPASAKQAEIPGWTPIDCHCSQAVSIDAVDSQRVYLGTASGVRRSDDGGFSWHVLSMPAGGSVSRVSFADRDHGAAVGSFEGVMVTSDGGDTWKQFRPFLGTTLDVRALPGRLFGLATSGLYTSTDGGVVWKRINKNNRSLNARMAWSSPTDGVIVEAPAVLTTTDGGATFTTAPVGALALNDGLSVGAHDAFAVGVASVHSGRALITHVTGTIASSAVLDDRGVADENAHGISSAAHTLYVVGEEGLLARSTDGGSTWTYEKPPPSYERSNFWSVDSLDATHAWVAVYSGRVLIRNASTLHDVSTSPHRGFGIGLLVIAVGAAAAGVWALRSGQPKPVVGVITAVFVLATAGGVIAMTNSKTCHAYGCAAVAALPEPSLPPLPTASPTPSPTPSATPSPTASPTPSPTPSPTASPTKSPTPSPTPLGAFTAVLTKAPSCDGNGGAHAGTITLHNTTAVPALWSAAAREKTGQQQPWASLTPTQGTLAPGAKTTVSVLPDDSFCVPGNPPSTEHVDVHQGTTTIPVAVTVTPLT